jgi:uncharacterized protein YbaR (Trm112 family)
VKAPVSDALLALLRCPDTGQELALASSAQVERLNAAIARGKLRDRAGQIVSEPIEAALVRADRAFAYPVRCGVPELLVSEALPLDE